MAMAVGSGGKEETDTKMGRKKKKKLETTVSRPERGGKKRKDRKS